MKRSTTTKRKEAPNKIPHKQRWKTVLVALGLLLWVGVSVVASQFVVGYLMIWILGLDAFERPVVTAAFSAISYIVAMFLIILVPPRILAKWSRNAKSNHENAAKRNELKTSRREELGLAGLPTWTDVGLAPVGFIVYLMIASGLVMLFSQFMWFDASEAQDVGFAVGLYGADRLIAFFTLVVVAPIAEEIIFRGWLYEKLRVRFNEVASNTVSIVISSILVSLLFGLVHGQWNVGVNVFAMSLVLCVLREITGTIYAGILLHMLKNGVAFYLLYVAGFGT